MNERMNISKMQTVAHLLGVEPEDLTGGLNLVQAAKLLGIAPSTLRQRALAGEIGCQRDGRAWRFYWWHLARYLEEREWPAHESVVSAVSASRPGSGSLEGEDILLEAERLGLL